MSHALLLLETEYILFLIWLYQPAAIIISTISQMLKPSLERGKNNLQKLHQFLGFESSPGWPLNLNPFRIVQLPVWTQTAKKPAKYLEDRRKQVFFFFLTSTAKQW